jgi:Gas vesicle synthesis protein GvpL/GvpF
MSTTPATAIENGKHIYAIVPSETPDNYGEIGINGCIVYKVQNGSLAAIVSDITTRRLRPERKNLAAHNHVLRTILNETTPLPVSFGVVANNQEQVKAILKRHEDTLSEQLDRLEGKIEMSVRVVLDVENVFEYFVANYDVLKNARNQIFAKDRKPSQDEKIEVGRLFEQILNNERERYADNLTNSLEDICAEIKQSPLRGEAELAHLTCLVSREKVELFEKCVEVQAEGLSDDFAFSLNGPFAPHNFVEMRLDF